MQVIVDSILTSYVREGKGEVLLLLHGWADSAAGLSGLTKSLAARYDVIVLNLPGFGGTEAPPEPWGLDNYASFTAHFLKKVGVARLYGVVAHSNGGALAIRGLASGELEAEKLVLLASSGIRNVYKGRNRSLRILAKTGKVLTMPLPASIKKKLRSEVYKTIGSDMLVAEHMQETFRRVVTDDVQADAARLTLPVLLIYGEQDESTPIWYGEQFHQLMPDSRLQILPDAGHFVHTDRPDDVEKAIREFLK
jgi:pimeloyl-ACP methyl ester carboxylesterase